MCKVHALPNLAAFQRKGKVVGHGTAGSPLEMLGEPAPCCCSAAASPGVTQAIFAAGDKAPGSRGEECRGLAALVSPCKEFWSCYLSKKGRESLDIAPEGIMQPSQFKFYQIPGVLWMTTMD